MAKGDHNGKLASLIKDGEQLKYLLAECEYGNAFKYLTADQWVLLWDKFYTWLNQNVGTNENPDSAVLEESLKFLTLTLKHENPEHCVSVVYKTVKHLFSTFNEVSNNNILNLLCKLCAEWLSQNHPVVPNMDAFVFRYFLSQCVNSSTPLVCNVKQLNSLRRHLNSSLILNEISSINDLVQNPKFIAMDAGQKFFGFVASQSTEAFNKIFSTATLELKKCTQRTAKCYGHALVLSWQNADPDTKLQISCKFQELMEDFLKRKRQSLELPKHSANILLVIDVWNVEARKKTDSAFITMITECYKPIIWKYLLCGHNFQRCNAADLFFKAFPFETSEDAFTNGELFLKQIDAMEKTLTDDCHIIRIIAVREVCNILAAYWTLFSNSQIQRLMEIITKQVVRDRSSVEVRRMVWRGFESFLVSDLARAYLQKILPSLKDYLYDMSPGVRIAFIRLMISIRNLQNVNFIYTSVVSTTEVIKCLQNEESQVGQWLVTLLLPAFYKPSTAENVWLHKFLAMIKKFPHCYRNFFFFSKKCLPFKEAKKIMCALIENLGSYVMRKLNAGDEENQSLVANVDGKSKNASKKKTTNPPQVENCAYDDPDIVIGILDIVGILWGLHSNSLNTNREASTELINTYVGHAQHFIRYFKDTRVFTAVIHVTGNVPISVLTQNSITLQGYCLKKFKTQDLDDALILIMINALVKWGGAGELLEIITRWLEAALKSNDNDDVVSNVKRVKISDEDKPNALLAVRLLDSILEKAVTRFPTLEKNYRNLLEIFHLMDGVKNLIYHRLLCGMPYSDEQRTDEFLQVCFRRYVKLLPLLYRNEEQLSNDCEENAVDVTRELRDLMSWMQDNLIPMLHSEQQAYPPLIVLSINEVLGLAESMLKVHYIDHDEFPKFEQIMASLLGLSKNLHFIEASSRLTLAMSAYSMVYSPDKCPRIWLEIVPNMLSNIMNAFIVQTHSPELFTAEIAAVGGNVKKIFAKYEVLLNDPACRKETITCVQAIFERMLNCIRAVLGRNIIREDNTIRCYSELSTLPATVGALLAPVYKHPMWSTYLNFAIREFSASSLKTILIDAIIMRCLVQCPHVRFRETAARMITHYFTLLENFKSMRKNRPRESMGVTLVYEAKKSASEDDSGDDDDEEEEINKIPETQPVSAASLHRESEPASNVVTVGSEPHQSQPSGADVVDSVESEAADLISNVSLGPSEQILLSQTAVSGSQSNKKLPVAPQISTTGNSTMNRVLDDDQYANDFIACSEEILNNIQKILTSPNARSANVPIAVCMGTEGKTCAQTDEC